MTFPNDGTAFISPCLATLVEAPPSGLDWAHEIKFDGYRVQAHVDKARVRVFSRTGIDWTHRFGAVVDELGRLPVEDVIIDGEAVVQDADGITDFALLTEELKARGSRRIAIMAFDILRLDSVDLRSLPLRERKSRLRTLLDRHENRSLVVYSSDMIADDTAALVAEVCARGLEGIVSKRLDRPYTSGRGRDWLKCKCLSAAPFIVVGYVPSKAAAAAIGALVLGYYLDGRLTYAGRVGTGFSNQHAAELWRLLQAMKVEPPPFARGLTRAQRQDVVWVEPRLVTRITYRGFTSDGVLRHAVFDGVRTDKPPTEIGDPRRTPPEQQ